MYVLKTNTEVRIAVGPLVDPTDGKTAETALTVTGLTCDILQMANDGGAVVRTSFAPTASGGSNDMIHVSSDAVGMYDLELTAAQLNFYGNARLVFYDVDGFLVHWIDIQVVSAAYFDWIYGTTLPNVNVTQISGDSTAADNEEAFFDGTGYAGTNNTIPTVTNVTNLHASAATSAELAKVPKSDSTVSWNATALAAIKTAIEGAGSHLALIKAKTDNLPTAPADDTSIDTQLATIAGYLDTEIAAILAAVDTEVAAIKAKTDGLNFSGTDVKATLDGETVALTRPTGSVVSDAGNSTTVFKTDLSSSEDDYIKDAYVKFTSGANINQVKKVSAYNGTTKTVTCAAFTDIPSAADTFTIINE